MTEKPLARRRLEGIVGTGECTIGERVSMAEEVLLRRNICAAAARAIAVGILARNKTGCCWHTVIDDGNVGDDNVDRCANAFDPLHIDCATLTSLLEFLSEDERERLFEGVQAFQNAE